MARKIIDVKKVKEEKEKDKQKINKLEQELVNTQLALTEVAEMILT